MIDFIVADITTDCYSQQLVRWKEASIPIF